MLPARVASKSQCLWCPLVVLWATSGQLFSKSGHNPSLASNTMEKVSKNNAHVLYITWRATQRPYSEISNPSSSPCWDQRDSNSFILSWTERPSFKLCAPNTKKKRIKISSYVKIVNVFDVKGETHIQKAFTFDLTTPIWRVRDDFFLRKAELLVFVPVPSGKIRQREALWGQQSQ